MSNQNLYPLVNTINYTKPELTLILIGTFFWNIAYYFIIKDAIKYKKVEMPFLAVSSNIAWEFCWSFLLFTDLGTVFQWGLRIWFFMDAFIFYYTLKYGSLQMSKNIFGKYFIAFMFLITAWWIAVFYWFEKEGYDTLMGTTSAYLITVVMAALFVYNGSRKASGIIVSKKVAWSKCIGNLLMSVFVFLHHPTSHFLHLLTIAVLILNIVYITQSYKLKNIPNN
jgi:hypothetical protein